jgi:hypothetical protein
MVCCVFQATNLVKITDQESPRGLSQVSKKPAINYIRCWQLAFIRLNLFRNFCQTDKNNFRLRVQIQVFLNPFFS